MKNTCRGRYRKKPKKIVQLDKNIKQVSDNYQAGKMWNSGIMRHGYVYSAETRAIESEKKLTLGDILQDESVIPEKYYLSKEQLMKFKYLRGPKKIERQSEFGHTYTFSEGGMSEYDSLDLPGRTMLTSEGTTNRSTHLLKINGRYRFLTPIEAERLQDFPDNWTKYKQLDDGKISQVSDRMRYFFMGNALVTTIVTRIGLELRKIILENNESVSYTHLTLPTICSV